ncbi:MAG: hypothetical protein ACLFS1_01465 [Opitutales bacterium]
MRKLILYALTLLALTAVILVIWPRLLEPDPEPEAEETAQELPGLAEKTDADSPADQSESVGDDEAFSEPFSAPDSMLSAAENVPAVKDVEWAEERRQRMAGLIRQDPEAALAEALTPRQYAALPEAVQALVERPIATEDFYGVYAVCDHGAGASHSDACEINREVVLGMGTFDSEALRAHIYGAREKKATVENDALYGVALDGEIALHEDEAVLVDDGPDAAEGRYAVYHGNEVHYFEDLNEAEALRTRLNQ